ncbi:MAG: hypothetical protein COB07_05920 [Sulfurovum sp.]|nr:MAG: hypothetical protein COB07_05920 [Sulfurovum sp.]
MKISTDGLKIVKHFEGLFLKAYVDPVGIWIIGYGHTGSVAYAGNEITEKKADDLLREDMKESEYFVDRYCEVNLSQQQFDALVSFTFNVGGGALAKSTLRKKLNAEDFEGASNEFPRWNKGTVNGTKVVLPGLTRRRKSEHHLFDTNEVVFFDDRGVLDPDGEENETLTMVEMPSELESMEAGGGAGFLAHKGLHTAGADEGILRDLGKTYGISFPVDLLIELRNDRYPTSRPQFWAVVDFDLHSSKPRLFVLDVVEKKVNSYLCAHGIGSEGSTDDGFASVFKNKKNSKSTSLGIYRCAETYNSNRNGYSLRLDGLEDTNSNARSRYIVMHGARYVSRDFVSEYQRIGRSEGCPALDHKYATNVIDQLKLGSFLIHWKAP